MTYRLYLSNRPRHSRTITVATAGELRLAIIRFAADLGVSGEAINAIKI